MIVNRNELFKIAEREYKHTGITILDITGDIDISSTPPLGLYINNIIKMKKNKIILNLKNVAYVSSTGWGLFISLIKAVRENNGDIKLAELQPEVKVIFDMTSIEKLISSYKTVEEAAKAF